MWLQWTASPPNVVDIDGDGKNEVVGIPNAEMKEPYETQAYAFMVLEGAHGDGARSARRHRRLRDAADERQAGRARPDGDWYPPSGIPAPTIVNIVGDGRPEIVAAVQRRLRLRRRPDRQAAVALRLRAGRGEDVRLGGRGRRSQPGREPRARLRHLLARRRRAGRLVVLANTGKLLHDVVLPNQGTNGNGIGVPAAPTIGDLDGDGQLEIV